MHQLNPNTKFMTSRFWTFSVIFVVSMGAIGLFSWFYGSVEYYLPHGFSATSRSLNSILGAVLTSIALVISLTSNLYTPRLVKLFVTHPVILVGLSIMIGAHLFMATSMFFPDDSPVRVPLLIICTTLGYTAYAGILPFLYMVSKFLSPSYFLPALTQKATRKVQGIPNSRNLESDNRQIFDHVNVIANIAFTGMRRGDRQLVLLTLHGLHEILMEIISLDLKKSSAWRASDPVYSASLAKEGRQFLKKAEIWPEAYLLSQLVQIMEQTDAKQNEMLSVAAEHLLKSAQLALTKRSESVLELHILVFNTLMRNAIEDRDLRKFQNLSYHYRAFMEALAEEQKWMSEIARHLLHYGRRASKLMPFAYETVLYDLGEITLALATEEYSALTFLHIYSGPAWSEAIAKGGQQANAAWRSMIRVYWEATSHEYVLLAETLRAEFLKDDEHQRHLMKIIEDNRPLHWEYNDRLLRFAYLSPEAEKLAASFSSGTL